MLSVPPVSTSTPAWRASSVVRAAATARAPSTQWVDYHLTINYCPMILSDDARGDDAPPFGAREGPVISPVSSARAEPGPSGPRHKPPA